MVSVLAFYSDNPSSNPAEDCSFLLKFVFEKNDNKHKKRLGLAPFLYRKQYVVICKDKNSFIAHMSII